MHRSKEFDLPARAPSNHYSSSRFWRMHWFLLYGRKPLEVPFFTNCRLKFTVRERRKFEIPFDSCKSRDTLTSPLPSVFSLKFQLWFYGEIKEKGFKSTFIRWQFSYFLLFLFCSRQINEQKIEGKKERFTGLFR